MQRTGHKYSFEVRSAESEEKKESTDQDKDLSDSTNAVTSGLRPQKLSRDKAIQRVQQIFERSCGCELPGTFEPMLISLLFWDQSQPWGRVAMAHVNRVAQAYKAFVRKFFREAAPLELQNRLVKKIKSALAKSLADANGELQKLLKDEARQPSTYNHYFTTTIQEQRLDRYSHVHNSAVAESQENVCVQSVGYRTYIKPTMFERAMSAHVELDMDSFSCQDALDAQRAYYRDELKYCVNAVPKVVIERHLVAPLPEVILSPVTVSQMSEQEIWTMAEEDPGVVQKREQLKEERALLQKGMDMFDEVIGGFVRYDQMQ